MHSVYCLNTRLTVKSIIPKASKKVRSSKNVLHKVQINDSFQSLQESFPGYDPPLYTAREIRASPPGADPDILK